jgi:hypothetical protein
MGDSFTLVSQGAEDVYSAGLLHSQLGFFGNRAAKRLATNYESWIKRTQAVNGKNAVVVSGQAGDASIAVFLDSVSKMNRWKKIWFKFFIGSAQWNEITSGKYATIGEAVYRIAQSNVEKADSEQLQFRAKRGDRTYAAQVISKDLLEKVKEEVALATKLSYNGRTPVLIRDAVSKAMIAATDDQTGELKLEELSEILTEQGMPIEFSEEILTLSATPEFNRAALVAQIEASLTEQAITSLAESMIGRTTGKWFQALQKIERDHGYTKFWLTRAWHSWRYSRSFNRTFKNYIKDLEGVWLDSRGETYAVSPFKLVGWIQTAWRATVMSVFYWATGRSQIKKNQLEMITQETLNESVKDRTTQVLEDKAKEAHEVELQTTAKDRVLEQEIRTQVGVASEKDETEHFRMVRGATKLLNWWSSGEPLALRLRRPQASPFIARQTP